MPSCVVYYVYNIQYILLVSVFCFNNITRQEREQRTANYTVKTELNDGNVSKNPLLLFHFFINFFFLCYLFVAALAFHAVVVFLSPEALDSLVNGDGGMASAASKCGRVD